MYFSAPVGTGCAIYVSEYASKPLLVPDAKAQKPTGRRSIHPIRGGDNEPLLSTSALACLENGSLSCRADRATVKVEKTCSYDPAQTRGYDLRPALEATQAFAVVGCVSFSRHDTAVSARSRVLIRRPFRDLLGSIEPVTYSRSIVMIALHKPQRATYGQAVEAQHQEYNVVLCNHEGVRCLGNTGTYQCCI